MVQNISVLIIGQGGSYSNAGMKLKKRRNKIHSKSASETKDE